MDTRKQPEWTDQTEYCERCGISFIWSAEEQKHAAATAGVHPTDGKLKAPRYCSGCRRLLPGEDRERGVVKWYSRRRHYGFLIRRSDRDLFFHGSEVSGSTLHPGDLVEFGVETTEKGPQAVAVRRVARSSQPT